VPHAAGLYYETHGLADAPPVILSSGLGGSAAYWQPNLAALAARFRVIAYDHRGTGRSDRALPPIVTVDDFATDILALMDALGLPRAALIGHAAGAVAGFALALRSPDRVSRIVSVNGFAKADPHFRRCFAARLALLRHAGVEAFLRAQPIFLYPADWISTHDSELDAELTHQLAHFPGVETMEKRIAALAGFDIMSRLHDIAMPVLALIATDDMLVPPRAGHALAAGLPNATVATMGGAHACNIVDPDRFAAIVLPFLES
jgi:aminoacrylate hydrolase